MRQTKEKWLFQPGLSWHLLFSPQRLSLKERSLTFWVDRSVLKSIMIT
jgi:hypothetical protein